MSQFYASVVIPTYNQRPEFLAASIRSVFAQTVPVELIVVDDGSTPAVRLDVTAPPGGIHSWRLITHEQNRGISAALNTGIAAASSPWWCWLSSDDLMGPTKIEIQRRETDRAGALCSYHDYAQLWADGKVGLPSQCRFGWRSIDEQMRDLQHWCAINGSTVMVHRRVFDEAGTFDEGYRYGQDWEMWCRIGERFLWHGIPDRLGVRNMGGNLTEQIETDPARRKIRDEEDRKIRRRYRR